MNPVSVYRDIILRFNTYPTPVDRKIVLVCVTNPFVNDIKQGRKALG